MFKKILIANRGEIACRIIRTARRMGISSAVVFSEVDSRAQHVLLADESIPIGPASATHSYLDIDKVVGAGKDVGADAIHPGYGFLSENAKFVRAVEESGMVFIGPGPKAIADMGDKIAAKNIAHKAGVNVIPGSPEAINNVNDLVKIANDIGYPIILKAAAGGGGKGMRVVESESQIIELFERAVSESEASFGDSRVFVEKYIRHPRHIEIQVLADNFGNAIHLGERECSIQRRHQKVIEEAPSLALDEASRAAMTDQALALVRAVDYCSAGTVEFVLDSEEKFYFLEMNTRLQVEHPTTELITGVDLVEEMIKVAAGVPLQLSQDDIKLNGWAIEARIYAEDPERGFIPSTGRLSRYMPPEDDTLRLDTGVTEGDVVSVFYDPLIAKLSSFGADREEAIMRLRYGLDRYVIEGVSNNVSFLNAVLGHDAFYRGQLNTDFITTYFSKDRVRRVDPDVEIKLIAIAAIVHTRYSFNLRKFSLAREESLGFTNRRNRYAAAPVINGTGGPACREQLRNVLGYKIQWVAVMGERQVPVSVTLSTKSYRVNVNGTEMEVESGWERGDRLFESVIDEKALAATVVRILDDYHVSQGGQSIITKLYRPKMADLAWVMSRDLKSNVGNLLRSPMPGMVVSVSVGKGDSVSEGQALLVLDAMKMENVLFADRSGTIAKIHISEGVSVSVDEVILEYD